MDIQTAAEPLYMPSTHLGTKAINIPRKCQTAEKVTGSKTGFQIQRKKRESGQYFAHQPIEEKSQ